MIHIINAAMSAATIVEPTGVPAIIEIIIPDEAQNTEKTAEQTVTELNDLKSRILASAGKI
ncbi:MAG: hypothetical protein MJZ63_02480, partial [Muribaculaceae bacterium]|nr:hypothetical protein [Muribaculaceae bacterium]